VGKASLVVTQILRPWFVFCQRGNAIHTVFTVQKFGYEMTVLRATPVR
jgi:hypothetical protein